jgi:hypothetical protein
VVGTKHVLPQGGDEFWSQVQEDYEAVDPSDDNVSPPSPDDVPGVGGEIEASGLFQNIAERRYVWDVTYTADEYIAVLDTYSGHRDLAPTKRKRLYDRIHKRVESRPDGKVTKSYLAILDIARLKNRAEL